MNNNAEKLYASWLADKAEKEWLFAESKYRKLHDMAVDMYDGGEWHDYRHDTQEEQ